MRGDAERVADMLEAAVNHWHQTVSGDPDRKGSIARWESIAGQNVLGERYQLLLASSTRVTDLASSRWVWALTSTPC